MNIPQHHIDQIIEQIDNSEFKSVEMIGGGGRMANKYLLTFACYPEDTDVIYNTPPERYYQVEVETDSFDYDIDDFPELEDILPNLYEVKPKMVLRTQWEKV